jgi:uncharacterized protein YjbJ (UPF0337 family)
MTVLKKEKIMNRDVLKGNWKQFRGKVKETWGELTDDEIAQVEGNYDQLVGKLQEKYGYSRDRAEREVDRFMSDSEMHDR